MIGVDEMEDIRKRARGSESIASIARAVGASEPTVRKYARMEDRRPNPRGGAGPRARSSRHTRRRSTPGSTTTAGTGASSATRRRGST